MRVYMKIICFCLLITLTSQQENIPKPRHNREVNPTNVKPQEIVEGFSRAIKNVGSKANRVESIQKSIEEWIIEGSDLNSREIVQDLADKLRVRLQEKIGAAKKISTAVAEAYNIGKSQKQKYHLCCKMPSEYKVTYDPRYKDKVTDALFCSMKAPAALKEDDIDFSNVRTVFDRNKLKVKWQYFGSIKGVTIGYPAAHVSTCGVYDNRIRPWYVNTATPSPKNIVILMDSSTSIGKHMDAVKDTAKIVVSTLNQKDKVSLILFNSTTFLRADNNTDECYNTTMATARTFNIKYLKSFIDSAQPIGGTRFIRAFKKAFEILKNTLKTSSKSIASRPSMILLLTDGAPKTSDVEKKVLQAITNEVDTFKQEYKDTTFKLLTLQLGSDKESTKFVKKLTEQTNGIFMKAQGKKDPYSKLKGYFDYLMEVTPAKESVVVFSPPYLDSWGLGLMVTAASAYFHQNELRGVAGVDIPMTDLLSDVLYFNQAGPKSYAFLYHSETGDTLSHPKLPTPEAVTEDPNTVNILELEQGKEFKTLFDEVRRTGRLRDAIFKGVKRSISRGSMPGDGVKTEQIDYKYSCMPVDLGAYRKDYIVCVALQRGDTGANFKSIGIENQMSQAPVTYHRMDVLPEDKTCYHTDTVSYADRSVIKFSTKAFEDPPGYLEGEESAEAVKLYVNQMIGRAFKSEESYVFAEDAEVSAMLTSLVDETWFATVNQKEFLSKFVRRYIGTYNGVLRMYPGAPLPTDFDHISRPWFICAAANEGLASITAPYLDPLGAGFIVSISHSLKTSYGKKNLFGVIGADVTVSNFGAMFRKHIGKKCLDSINRLNCFLLDSSGYVVYHPSFDIAYNDSGRVLNKHITEIDAVIARDLIISGVMVRRECQNFNLLKLQRFYEIVMPKDMHTSKETGQTTCSSYAIVKVPYTNVFVVVTKGPECFINRPSCPCYDTCTTNKSNACECPCKGRLEYNFCNASLTSESDIPVCTQPSPPVATRAPLNGHPDDLGRCFSVHCGEYQKENDCNEIFGCFWCYKEMDGSLLKTPSCKSDRHCYGGVLGRENPFLLPHKEKRKAKERKVFTIFGLKLNMMTLIAGSSGLGGGVVLIFIICIVCCLCRRKGKSGEEEIEFQSMDMFATEDQTQMMDPVDAINMDQGFAPLPLNYPGQSRAMQSNMKMQSNMQMPSNMQMRLGGPGMSYSTQAMSGMWSRAYHQSQLMSFVPQVSTMQTPGAYPSKPKRKRAKPKQQRRVSFSENVAEVTEDVPEVTEDVPEVAEEELITVSGDTPIVTEDLQVAEAQVITQDQEMTGYLEVIEYAGLSEYQEVTQEPEVIEDPEVTEYPEVYNDPGFTEDPSIEDGDL